MMVYLRECSGGFNGWTQEGKLVLGMEVEGATVLLERIVGKSKDI